MRSGDVATSARPLAEIEVVELDGRLAGRLCAELLCRHGASLTRLGEATQRSADWSTADVVIVSSTHGRSREDLDAVLARPGTKERVICAISPYGLDPGDVPVDDPTELQLQAVTGLMATTGMAGGPPAGVAVPLVEAFAALNAATAVLAALRLIRAGGAGQLIDISVFDAAFSLHGSFLGKLHDGAARGLRGGCRHPICAPWNAYPTSDGWVIICSVTDEQWQHLLRVMGREDLSGDPRFATLRSRVDNVEAVDDVVAAWTRSGTLQAVVSAVHAAGIPAGSVADANAVAACGTATPCRWRLFPGRSGRAPALSPKAPLGGVRVVEIGPYTAGPLAGRFLANLGADTVKVEPPDGEVSRKWTPQIDGTSLYFTNYNSGKRSVRLDLRAADAGERLSWLADRADVLIQNLRPGQLDRLGCGPEALLAGTGVRVYCSISGYGSGGSAVPAVDTVIQAEGGLVALIPTDGAPVKSGVSVADVIAGQWAVLEILAALFETDCSGRRVFLDISMIDCIRWLVGLSRRARAEIAPDHVVLSGSDGWVLAEGTFADSPPRLPEGANVPVTTDTIIRCVRAAGARAVRVLELDEAFALPLVRRRGLLVGRPCGRLASGHVLAAPFGLTGTPPAPLATAPALGAEEVGLIWNEGRGG